MAHYAACDALDLFADETLAIGGEVVHALQKTFIGSVVKSASSGMGISPLTGLEKFTSVRARSIKGGGARVVRCGPKDVRIEFKGEPFAAIRYFRIAYRGFIQAGCGFIIAARGGRGAGGVSVGDDARVSDRMGVSCAQTALRSRCTQPRRVASSRGLLCDVNSGSISTN